jgi:energy-converting hydrogenase Eha subunit E
LPVPGLEGRLLLIGPADSDPVVRILKVKLGEEPGAGKAVYKVANER